MENFPWKQLDGQLLLLFTFVEWHLGKNTHLKLEMLVSLRTILGLYSQNGSSSSYSEIKVKIRD